MIWTVFFMALFFPAMALHAWAENKCTALDVATGRRDAGALVDDYGSNRGWYWPYKPISLVAALAAAPGALLWFFFALSLLAGAGP